MKIKGMFYKVLIGMIIASLLLGIWVIYQVNASTKFTLDDCPYNIKFVKISTDWYVSMGIDTEGNLWGWGYDCSQCNIFGENNKPGSVPVQIKEGTKFKDIAVNSSHALAIDINGNLWAWGDNSDGKLGNGTTTSSATPIKIKSGTKFKEISVTRYGSSAIDEDGNLWSWGASTSSLGLGHITEDVLEPQIVLEGTKFVKIKIGGNHSLAIDEDGYIYTWGDNSQGQLGNGTSSVADIYVPTRLQIDTTFIEIAAGTHCNLAIDSNGNIWSWGVNDHGQLGNGNTTNLLVPTKITEGRTFIKITCGNGGLVTENASFAIDSDGNLWSWGSNEDYWLGNGSKEDVLEPQQILQGKTFKEISAGLNYAVGVDTNGNGWSWGYFAFGAKGTGSSAPYNKAIRFTGEDYVVTFKDGDNIIKQQNVKFNKTATSPLISKDGYTLSWDKETYGIMEDTTIQTIWTKNANYKVEHYIQNDEKNGYILKETENMIGAIGTTVNAKVRGYEGYRENLLNEETINEGIITEDGSLTLKLYYDKTDFIKEDLAYNISFKEISTYNKNTVAIDENGQLWAWGYNQNGQLGDGGINSSSTPVKLKNNVKFIKVSVGTENVKAIDENGGLWVWGNYYEEKIGEPIQIETDKKFKDITKQLVLDEEGNLWTWEDKTLVQIKEGTKFTQISSSGNHNLAIDENSNLWAWGDNTYGQLGNGTTTNSNVPVQIKEGTKFTQISAGAYHTIAIDEEGNLWTWGYNYLGQLGDGTTTNSSIPVQIKEETKFSQISAGNVHNMAIDEEGNLWTWGYNRSGQLGNGTMTDSNVPVQIIGDKKVKYIEAGENNSFIIDSNNNLWAFGNNSNGELGNGESSYVKKPVNVSVEMEFEKIENGSGYILAIDKEGNLWTWGSNSYGLGDGTTKSSKIPIQIKEGTKFKEISSHDYHNIAIDINGNLWAWGRNSFGQLGDGTTTNSSIPVQIKEGTKFVKISTGYYHTMAIDEDGNLWTWGYNRYGQLGDGTTNDSIIPLKIASETKFSQISVGYYDSLAIDIDGNLWSWGRYVYGNGMVKNQYNSLGVEGSLVPVKIDNMGKFTKVSLGDNCMLAIDEDGNLWSCISNQYNKFAKDKKDECGKLIQVMPGTKFKDIAFGKEHALAIDINGNLWTWGNNTDGQLGDGTTIDSYLPIQIENGIKFSKISVDDSISIGVSEDDEILIFGNGISTIVGLSYNYSTPIQITSSKISEFTVTFKDGETVLKTETVTSGESATAPELTKAGYTLSWDKEFSNITEDITVNAVWTANTNTAYKVEHYVRNLDTEVEGYELRETENLIGTTDETVTATAKTYEGFTENTEYEGRIPSGVIAGDGSLVLKLYYNRNSYNITYELNGGTANTTLVNKYVYGKELILTNRVTKEGFIFAGWYDNEELTGEVVTTIGANEIGDKTFYAKWLEEDTEEYYIISSIYTIDTSKNIITKVRPETKVEEFINNLTTNGTTKVVDQSGKEVSQKALVGTGYKIQISHNGTNYEYEIAVRGDLDGNGKITVTDLSAMNQALTGKTPLTGIYKIGADIDYNGSLTVTDLSMINQALVGKINL